ncbi:response regulator [Stakelama tenebrarum]|uniref:Response regulator n=1 Tax=Stakelama tenebrarum TaxID=2711215 RepID=A0A6G6Y1Z2_9SPHN|nr:response regulator [Sphingosinithalassobacter tenebrarum]QIG78738.1 response regulator [Sphingosinithalassobacter tenebrarum]
MSEEDERAQPAIARKRRRTILAVDDNRTNLHVLAQRLGEQGYLVVQSDSGAEALDLISGRGFDLVLLDMAMPHVNGLAVLREIRGSRDTADLPVILMTGQSEPNEAVDALASGADDYVAKPFEFEVLAARIARTLARAQRVEELKRSNLALDARIAARAIELGEARSELASNRADRTRLIASIQALHDEVERLSAGTSAF